MKIFNIAAGDNTTVGTMCRSCVASIYFCFTAFQSYLSSSIHYAYPIQRKSTVYWI